ncbi:hypothetical protein Tco_0649711 [Tanacetum coccineum]
MAPRCLMKDIDTGYESYKNPNHLEASCSQEHLKGNALYLYKDINLQVEDQDPVLLIRQKGEKESKELELMGEKISY